MKTTILVEKEIEVKYVRVEMAVRYEEEDIPYDFPFRDGDMWRGVIDVDSGVILEWPQGKEGVLAMKVCDEGTYELLDSDHNSMAIVRDEYVPNALLPGKFGDYVDLRIDKTGKITNWYESPSLRDFYGNNE